MALTVELLVDLIHSTASPVPLLKHIKGYDVGIPLYALEALISVSGKSHPPPFSPEERSAIEKFRKEHSGAQADEVFNNVLVGNKAAAEDVEFILGKGVTHLLNCAGTVGSWDTVTPDVDQLEKNGVKVMQLKLVDKDNVEISTHFPDTNAWMKEALDKGGKVLVNCFQGASRSATVVLAYLVQHQNMKVDDALVMIKQKRDIRPNNGFLSQIIQFSNICHKS